MDEPSWLQHAGKAGGSVGQHWELVAPGDMALAPAAAPGKAGPLYWPKRGCEFYKDNSQGLSVPILRWEWHNSLAGSALMDSAVSPV